MSFDGSYRWSPQNNKWEPADFKKYGKIILIALLALVVFIGAMTCFYTVDEKQQAVVTTFGRVTDVTGAGVHFKLPFGIQQANLVDVNVFQKLELGYRTNSNGTSTSVDSESSMITGDYNIVNVDFFVEYKISDPVKYLYASEAPKEVLRNLIQSQVRNVVGSSTVDATLTDGKAGIQAQVRPWLPKFCRSMTSVWCWWMCVFRMQSLPRRKSPRHLRRWKLPSSGQRPLLTKQRLIRMPSCRKPRRMQINSFKMPST